MGGSGSVLLPPGEAAAAAQRNGAVRPRGGEAARPPPGVRSPGSRGFSQPWRPRGARSCGQRRVLPAQKGEGTAPAGPGPPTHRPAPTAARGRRVPRAKHGGRVRVRARPRDPATHSRPRFPPPGCGSVRRVARRRRGAGSPEPLPRAGGGRPVRRDARQPRPQIAGDAPPALPVGSNFSASAPSAPSCRCRSRCQSARRGPGAAPARGAGGSARPPHRPLLPGGGRRWT